MVKVMRGLEILSQSKNARLELNVLSNYNSRLAQDFVNNKGVLSYVLDYCVDSVMFLTCNKISFLRLVFIYSIGDYFFIDREGVF